MQHALSACQTALAQDSYSLRHDTVLNELMDILERERRKKRQTKKKASLAINCVKGDQTAKKRKATSVVDEFDCWEMKVDLGKQLVFPNINHVKQRPDIVICLLNDRKLVMVRLRVPCEIRCEKGYEQKMAKYTELLEPYKHRGWSTWLFCSGDRMQRVPSSIW